MAPIYPQKYTQRPEQCPPFDPETDHPDCPATTCLKVYVGELFCRVLTSGVLCPYTRPFSRTPALLLHIRQKHPEVIIHSKRGKATIEQKIAAQIHFMDIESQILNPERTPGSPSGTRDINP